VRNAVQFGYLNLAEDAYPSLSGGTSGLDLVLCRNVLIYFDGETVARVAARLLDGLSGDGWLLLGASDPPLADLVPCEVVVTDAGLAYRRPRSGARVAPRPAPKADSPAHTPPPRAPFLVADPPRASRPAALAVPPAPPPDAREARGAYAERDFGRAAELATRLVRDGGIAGGMPEVWVLLVRALANQGSLADAGRACATALDRHRTSAELAYLHAVLLGEGGRPAEAAAAARRALYLDRGLVPGHLALGGALARLGDADGARRAYRNAVRLLCLMAPDREVPAADGERAGRLLEMARVQLRLLGGAAA
jgi:chemotaxis protein methyltransferase CheR